MKSTRLVSSSGRCGIATFDDPTHLLLGQLADLARCLTLPNAGIGDLPHWAKEKGPAGDREAKRDKHCCSLVLSNERLRSLRSPDLET